MGKSKTIYKPPKGTRVSKKKLYKLTSKQHGGSILGNLSDSIFGKNIIGGNETIDGEGNPTGSTMEMSQDQASSGSAMEMSQDPASSVSAVSEDPASSVSTVSEDPASSGSAMEMEDDSSVKETTDSDDAMVTSPEIFTNEQKEEIQKMIDETLANAFRQTSESLTSEKTEDMMESSNTESDSVENNDNEANPMQLAANSASETFNELVSGQGDSESAKDTSEEQEESTPTSSDSSMNSSNGGKRKKKKGSRKRRKVRFTK